MFAVELIGIAVLREFGILITAVLLAGRSASSFAAEIGSMKMNQEIDAMQVMGVDPFEALVLPRFLALLLTIPLLTFVADPGRPGRRPGGDLVGAGPQPDLLPPADRRQRAAHALLGRPVQGAGDGRSSSPRIGCRQGMEVGGDVESLGRRVTAAVVHAIFAIILIDAVFALIYMQLDV